MLDNARQDLLLSKSKCKKPQLLSLFLTWIFVKAKATSRYISTAKGNT